MNRLIGIAGWVNVVNDESICFYTPVTLSLLVPSIMIDFEYPLFFEKGNLGKCFFRNIYVQKEHL